MLWPPPPSSLGLLPVMDRAQATVNLVAQERWNAEECNSGAARNEWSLQVPG